MKYDSWIHSFSGTTNPHRGGGECKAYSICTVRRRVDRTGQTNKHSLVPQIRRTDLSEIRVFGNGRRRGHPEGVHTSKIPKMLHEFLAKSQLGDINPR